MEVFIVSKHVGWGENKIILGVYKNMKDVEFDLHKLGYFSDGQGWEHRAIHPGPRDGFKYAEVDKYVLQETHML